MPDRRLEFALTLIARISGGDAARAAHARKELEAWRRAAPEHETAVRQADAYWRAVGGAAAALNGVAPKPRKTPARKRSSRVIRAGTALGIAFVFALIVRWYVVQPVSVQRYATAVAQMQRVEFRDGSRLELAPHTRLQVRFYRDRRAVVFEAGEARFDVAPDRARPFTIQTRLAMVHVLGTAFTISDRGTRLVVSVERGRVAVAGISGHTPSTDVSAGERIVLEPGRRGAIEQVVPERHAPWRNGWLVFDDAPLSEALPMINAWRARPIVLADERAGLERLTGSFRTNDPEALLEALPKILPLIVRHRRDGSAELARR